MTTMGCLPTKQNINDVHPDIFTVTNVDDQGNTTFDAHLKVTNASIELFRKGLPPIKWPLKSLRRYGLDAEHFTFEAGRRCQTGPGVYAFKCSRAQQLFELVQNHVRLSSEAENARRASVGRVVAEEAPGEPRRPSSDLDHDPLQYVNVAMPEDAAASRSYYENVVLAASPASPEVAKEMRPPDHDLEPEEANVKINYVQLELTSSSRPEANNNESNSSSGSGSEDEANNAGRDYALIDFDRTQALSNAMRPPRAQLPMDAAEAEPESCGIRRTRHNSTLDSICNFSSANGIKRNSVINDNQPS